MPPPLGPELSPIHTANADFHFSYYQRSHREYKFTTASKQESSPYETLAILHFNDTSYKIEV